MNKILSILTKPIVIILVVLTADQWLKIWVKTNMILQQKIPLFGDWFFIDFIENRGMAFGMEFGGDIGKLILSLFRIVAVAGIGYYLFKIQKNAPTGLKISISLIFAGAVGNIIDSVFYGVIFSDSFNQLATFLPAGGGYAPFLHGWVVDMFHFYAFWPNWIPYLGGKEIFPPIFNLADASISVGITLIFIFQKRFFKKENPTAQISTENNNSLADQKE